MEELIKKLNALFSNPDATTEGEDGRLYFTGEDSDEIAYECNEYLITDNGGCNWDNIRILRDAGFRVYAGEKDSFGWLTGCIEKNGDPSYRVLVYG